MMRPAMLILLMCPGMIAGFAGAAGDPNQAAYSAIRDAEALRLQVELQRVSAVEPNQSVRADELKQVVSQIQSLQWLPEAAKPSGPALAEKPQETPKQAANATESNGKSIPGEPAHEEPAPAPIKHLDEIQNPVNPLAAADVLYRAKDYHRALRFYQIAAGSKEKKNIRDYQWALYQSANCMRHENPAGAIKIYQQLLAEYPDSAWSAAALTQQKNLEWFAQKQSLLADDKVNNDTNQQ